MTTTQSPTRPPKLQAQKKTNMGQHLIAAFVSVGIIGPIALMVTDRDAPYEFTHVEISPSKVVQGGEIEITFTVKQPRTPCGPGVVYRWFREEPSRKLHTYDPIPRAAPPVVVNGKFTRRSKLPDNISVGHVVYYGRSCYTCNVIQGLWPQLLSVCEDTPEVPFEILEREGLPPPPRRQSNFNDQEDVDSPKRPRAPTIVKGRVFQ